MILQRIYTVLAAMVIFTSCGDYKETPRPKKSLNEDLAITFDENQKNLIFNAPQIKDWKLYNLNADHTIGKPIIFNEKGILDKDLGNKRHYFLAVSGKDSVYLSNRHLAIEGAENARDLGGLFTKDGYQVKWGLIYRSGMLSEINNDEFEMLKSLNVQTICDFRQDAEIEEDPDTWPNIETINTVRITIGDDTISPKEVLKQLESDDFDGDMLMQEANRGFVNTASKSYTDFFKLLLNNKNYPILYHCSAGKDRAGFASAMILSALGVERKIIINEYLLTNYLTHGVSEDKIEKAALFYGIDADKLRKLMGVKVSYINAAFDAIDSKYGNVNNYLCEALGVCKREIEQLKSKLLYNYNSTITVDELGIELPENKDQITGKSMLEGANNFREFNVANGKLKPGILFRSDALHELTKADIKKLEAMNLKSVVDFRYENEIKEDPDKKINTVTKAVNYPIGRNPDELETLIDDETYNKIRTWYMDGNFKKVDSVLKLNNIDMAKSRIERYESFPLQFEESYGNFMKMLANPSNYPLVFHCQGGKDRAGFASALVLKTLGFSNDAIIQDYVTTNLFTYKNISGMYKMGVKSLEPSYGANAEQLRASFTAIDKEYGSFDNYLHKGLNLTDTDINNIRTNLLQ